MSIRKIIEYPEHNMAQLFIKSQSLKAKGLQAGVPTASTQCFLLVAVVPQPDGQLLIRS